MRILDRDATREALDFARLIPALRRQFSDGCSVPPRHHHVVPKMSGGQDGVLLLMPAWIPGRYMGVKIVAVAPGNSRQKLPAVNSTYLLSDGETGLPLLFLDGNQVTSRRTAAASALAADYLARRDAERLLIIGSGQVAAEIAPAYREVRKIREVRIWNHRFEGALELASKLTAQGFLAQAVENLEEAVRSSEMICSASLAAQPLIKGEWLRPGQHVDLIGSFTPDMREADDDVMRRGRLFVDTRLALHEAGDLVHPLAGGIIGPTDVLADLAELSRGSHPGRTSETEITVFKSVGIALEDLAAAVLAYEGAA